MTLGLTVTIADANLPAPGVKELVELHPDDLAVLRDEGPSHTLPRLQRLRAIHHSIAIRLAGGERPVDISCSLAVSQQTISKLTHDPQFIELVESYRGRFEDRVADTFQLLSAVKVEALNTLLERFEDDSERSQIGIETLRKLVETTADRTGESPIRRSENVHHHKGGLADDLVQRLIDAHAESPEWSQENVIDVTPENGHASSASGQGQDSAEAESPGDLEAKIYHPALAPVEALPAATQGNGLRESGEADSEV